MDRKRLICSSLLLAGLLSLAAATQARMQDSLQIGILSWHSVSDPWQNWQPLLMSLQQELPGHSIQLHFLALEEIETALADQQLDFVITNPGHYIALSQTYWLAPLATLHNPALDSARQAIGSVLLVRNERTDLQTWQDMTGKTLAAVSDQAFGGFQTIWDELEKNDVHLYRDITELRFTGYPMESLLELLDRGETDAIILRSCLLETLAEQGRLNLADYRAIGARQTGNYPCLLSTELYPNWPFLSAGTQPIELVSQLTQTLLASPWWSAPLSYQPVYQVFERLHLGPFSNFPRNPLLFILYQYRYLLLLGIAVVVLILVHYLRAEYLVRRRTHALQQAMTQQRKAEEQAHQSQTELLHLSRFALMGELAAGLAHELNQPLTAIVNYASGSCRLLEAADASCLPQKPRLLEVSQKIAAQGQRAAEIIRNLREFLRKQDASKEPLDARQLLQEALNFMDFRFRDQGIQLRQRITRQKVLLYGNRIQLMQILVNLLANAVDAMQKQPPDTRFLSVTLQLTQRNTLVCFCIQDSGEGLNESAQHHIFEPFFTTRPQGMGLGLRLSLTLAEAHKGQLQLYNHKKGGVRACLYLPRYQEGTHHDQQTTDMDSGR